MWWFLTMLWLDAVGRARRAQSENSSDWRDIWAGARYRVSGDVRSTAPLNAVQLASMLNMGPLEDVQIGQRPPYRFALTVKPIRSLRMRVPFEFVDPRSGVTIVIRELRELRSTEARV